MRNALSRIAFVVILMLAFVASPVFAAGGGKDGAEGVPRIFAPLWQIWGELASWMEKVQTGDRGSMMDPNGQTTSACSSDLGSAMDPDGCPRSQNFSDSGSMMDPNG